MTIHEPGKSEIQIACKDRDLLIATYSQLLLRKAGMLLFREVLHTEKSKSIIYASKFYSMTPIEQLSLSDGLFCLRSLPRPKIQDLT